MQALLERRIERSEVRGGFLTSCSSAGLECIEVRGLEDRNADMGQSVQNALLEVRIEKSDIRGGNPNLLLLSRLTACRS